VFQQVGVRAPRIHKKTHRKRLGYLQPVLENLLLKIGVEVIVAKVDWVAAVVAVRSGLRFADRLIEREIKNLESGISDLRFEIAQLIPACESVSRQLRKWAEHLQNTDIRGPRHLNEESREVYDRARRAEAFAEKLKRIRAGGKVEEEFGDSKSQI
jgi:hypothetical protein